MDKGIDVLTGENSLTPPSYVSTSEYVSCKKKSHKDKQSVIIHKKPKTIITYTYDADKYELRQHTHTGVRHKQEMGRKIKGHIN